MTRRGSFGPVVLAGLGSGALAAVAGSNAWWVESGADHPDPIQGVSLADPVASAGEMPLALALGLVLLACWGVLLVTRGRVRRLVALLGALAALGYAATVVTGALTLPDRVAAAVRESGLSNGGEAVVGPWFWAAAVAAVVAVAACAVAVAWLPAWPEMGSRYDAPGSDGAPVRDQPPLAERTHHDLWKSIDEGHDPTL